MDKNFEPVDLKSIQPLKVKENTSLIYFNIAKTIDPTILQGLEIDLENKDVQLFETGDTAFGVQVTDGIVCKQLIPMIINNGKFEKREFSKIVNIFETMPITGIKRKAIRKLEPRTLLKK